MTEIGSFIPEYTLEENDNEIKIMIVTPLSKPKAYDYVVKKNIFLFESLPYRLKIKLPHPVFQNSKTPTYNSVTKTYEIIFKKCDTEYIEGDKEDREIRSSVLCSNGEKTEQPDKNDEKKQFYGFANMYSNLFENYCGEFSEVINLPDPDHIEVHERRFLREKEENEKWNDDHYLADTMETDHLEPIFKYKPPWITSQAKNKHTDANKKKFYQTLCPKMETLLEDSKRLSEFQIVEVLFCYAYNVRTTEGENTVESGWTINKLSSTLSWFDVFDDLKSVILACYKRSLIFPLYRNWKLAQMVHKDVVDILKSGHLLQCLLKVRKIFNRSTNRYILNSLYIDDLCSFAFHFMNPKSLALAEELEKINIRKYQVNPDLPLLEIAAYLTLEEEKEEQGEEKTEGSDATESNIKDIVDKIAGVKLA